MLKRLPRARNRNWIAALLILVNQHGQQFGEFRFLRRKIFTLVKTQQFVRETFTFFVGVEDMGECAAQQAPVIHAGDQSVLIASNVEHRSPSNQVSVVIDLFQFRRGFPVCLTHHSIPCFEAGLRVRMSLPELFEGASFYDAHGLLGSHNENSKSSVSRALWHPAAAHTGNMSVEENSTPPEVLRRVLRVQTETRNQKREIRNWKF